MSDMISKSIACNGRAEMTNDSQNIPQKICCVLRKPLAVLCCAAAIGFFAAAFGDHAIAEEWVSLENGQKIQAGFLGMWQDNVVLRLSDGRRVVVPKAKLAAVSRLQADELAAKLAERRAERIAELSPTSSSEYAVNVEPAASYQPLPQSVSLKEYVEAASKQLEAGHIRVFWDGLPASFQNDVKEIIRSANSNADQNQQIVVQRLMVQLGRTLLKQREFVFNYPAMSQMPADAKSLMEQVYTPVAGIITVLGNQEVLSQDVLNSDDWDPMISKLDQELAPHLAQLIRAVPIEYNPLASLTSINPSSIEMSGDDRGSIAISDPDGNPVPLTFKLVDGKWLPDGLANSWKEGVAEAKKQAASNSQSSGEMAAAFTIGTTFFGATLGNIENAETQEEFNDTIDMIFGSVMQMAGNQMAGGNQGPGMGGQTPGFPGMGGPGMSGPGMSGHGSGGQPGPAMGGHDSGAGGSEPLGASSGGFSGSGTGIDK